MKQYVYRPSEAGLDKWPDGTLRLSGIEVTDDPKAADLFVIPGALTQLFPTREHLYRLPFMVGNEDRHVAFDCSDNEPLYDMACRFIRCNTRDWYPQRDPNTISWPWPVDDHSECIELPSGGFKYDVSFHGWITSHDTRRHSFQQMAGSALRCDLAGYNNFTGYLWDTPEGLRRRREFRRSLRESKLILCPESIAGVFPYRFYETMSAARIPVLVGSNFVFPYMGETSKSWFMHVPRHKVGTLNAAVTSFLHSHSDEEIIDMGREARRIYETWLHRDKWPELMAQAVLRSLQVAA